ncbi:N-acetylmuramoyl-L-alanine amidase [Blochmannia endosymbiont of Colobopsis nipponica]|uniref:N-acetylmuramoyl-L-alanine amidase n=1 Tax=Blochmannia endosymbiont of Colobopsis nipponica TaxID=2681987 RepID=UPI00178475B1|nr:N-acetylmuramoyl-L-alanine amidase [Blochmannia endosymbiont of Colobopsis nipponica]QOI10775.1 N-acetylmuramoyl-L-alanine amidase [Blochmannia endosymbiont of Colobopsis nipponica]
MNGKVISSIALNCKFAFSPIFSLFSSFNLKGVTSDIIRFFYLNIIYILINLNGKSFWFYSIANICKDNLVFHFLVTNLIKGEYISFCRVISVVAKQILCFSQAMRKRISVMHLFDIKIKKDLFFSTILMAKKSVTATVLDKYDIQNNTPIIVVIDAGHGGQDPGAVSRNGLCEKNVTIAIARKLRNILIADKKFKPILTRNGDCFISVIDRSEFARKHGANVLISIHVDSAFNKEVKGFSVWILSSRRANREMDICLEQYKKNSIGFRGTSSLLTINRDVNPYFNQVILDLQFGYSQKVSYELGVCVLHHLRDFGKLHKLKPISSSFGVLRSPDIPSLLVETGFISNSSEEKLLSNNFYQKKIAIAIYKGLRAYFIAHPLYISSDRN